MHDIKDEKNHIITVKSSELPLSCPRPQDELWNKHPRVFLPIDRKHGEKNPVICPYCSTKYLLTD